MWRRYLLFQVPGWLAAGILAAVAIRFGAPALLAGTLAGLWVLKDLVLYPFVRRAYEAGDHVPEEALVGTSATAEDPLEPEGTVRIGPELWRARLLDPSRPVPRGARLRVVRLEGLTVVVEPAPEIE